MSKGIPRFMIDSSESVLMQREAKGDKTWLHTLQQAYYQVSRLSGYTSSTGRIPSLPEEIG